MHSRKIQQIHTRVCGLNNVYYYYYYTIIFVHKKLLKAYAAQIAEAYFKQIFHRYSLNRKNRTGLQPTFLTVIFCVFYFLMRKSFILLK